VFLAAPPERAPLEVDDVVAEGAQCPTTGRHGVVVEEAGDDLPEPIPLLAEWRMHLTPQFLFDLLESCSHAVAAALPPEEELAGRRCAADEGEAEEDRQGVVFRICLLLFCLLRSVGFGDGEPGV
jgi:hypothetical protein